MNCVPSREVDCAWCGKSIALRDQAYPTLFNVTRGNPHPFERVHVSLPLRKRVLDLFVAKEGSAIEAEGVNAVALCCSMHCQEQLECAWIEEHTELSLALN